MLKAKVAYNKLTLDKLKQHAKDLEIKIPKDLTRKNEIVDNMIEQMIKFEMPLTLPTESQPHFVTSRPAKREPPPQGAVAVGRGAGYSGGAYSVALGYEAGNADDYALGNYAIAIGYRAGYSRGVTNSIVLNASGGDLSAYESGLYINPIRYTAIQDGDYDGLMFYNTNTKEVRYSYTLDGGVF